MREKRGDAGGGGDSNGGASGGEDEEASKGEKNRMISMNKNTGTNAGMTADNVLTYNEAACFPNVAYS